MRELLTAVKRRNSLTVQGSATLPCDTVLTSTVDIEWESPSLCPSTLCLSDEFLVQICTVHHKYVCARAEATPSAVSRSEARFRRLSLSASFSTALACISARRTALSSALRPPGLYGARLTARLDAASRSSASFEAAAAAKRRSFSANLALQGWRHRIEGRGHCKH